MFTKIYWIHTFENSTQLGIMPRPRGEDWLEDEINNFKKQNVAVIVSLLTKDEMQELGLKRQEEFCKKSGIQYINFPIIDRSIPKVSDKIDDLIVTLTGFLQQGKSVIVHCRMGIGRSSIIAASILVAQGLKVDNIIQTIIKIRGLKVPDTDQQLAWLKARQ